jgi:uncharacterized membrane protein YedE/YeeE
MKLMMALIAGLLFGLGLSLGGMTQPAVVLGFLDISGAWNPRLIFVMAGAVMTTAIGYRLVMHRASPWLEPAFRLPATHRVDARLIIGAALFGMGWGMAGYCPGPALASLSSGLAPVYVLMATMALGWWLAAKLPAHMGRNDAK